MKFSDIIKFDQPYIYMHVQLLTTNEIKIVTHIMHKIILLLFKLEDLCFFFFMNNMLY